MFALCIVFIGMLRVFTLVGKTGYCEKQTNVLKCAVAYSWHKNPLEMTECATSATEIILNS